MLREKRKDSLCGFHGVFQPMRCPAPSRLTNVTRSPDSCSSRRPFSGGGSFVVLSLDDQHGPIPPSPPMLDWCVYSWYSYFVKSLKIRPIPCQGTGRQFEPGFPLHFVVYQRVTIHFASVFLSLRTCTCIKVQVLITRHLIALLACSKPSSDAKF